ncbi:MAG: DUF2177 family protein [Candidatus Pacebacteria bacterium]|nr:DUF2177 family protein [Candidatus Paceibacterota bacterium]
MNTILYILTLFVLSIFDITWLYTMGAQYKVWLGHLFAPTVNFVPAVIFYLLYTLGVVYFVIAPAIAKGSTLSNGLWGVLLSGLLFGLICYATYDLTNHATMLRWPTIVTIVDMIWGAVLTGLTSVIVFAIYKKFF